MRAFPDLLSRTCETLLPQALLHDVRADRLLGAAAQDVLRRPCTARDIARRQELFARMDEMPSLAARLETLLGQLTELERLCAWWRETDTIVVRACALRRVLGAYRQACEAIAALTDGGELLSEAAVWVADAEVRAYLDGMRRDEAQLGELLAPLCGGMLSFGDKVWLMPDGEHVSEWERIATLGGALGLAVPARRSMRAALPRSLSDALCRLHETQAAAVQALCETYEAGLSDAPLALIAPLRFVLEIHALVCRAAQRGVPHCLPRIADAPCYTAHALYDISLMDGEVAEIVPNEAGFSREEPFFFVLGANGGGKTTYLRAVGLNLLLFLAGCPVFAEHACLYPFATVASHFPRDERFDGVGRLDEERARAADMLAAARDGVAFLLFNETFSGADEQRGYRLLCETVAQLRAAGAFGLYVTHFHEVMDGDEPVLMAQVDSADQNRRTYRLCKAKGCAASYAADILRKYRLDARSLAERRAHDGH